MRFQASCYVILLSLFLYITPCFSAQGDIVNQCGNFADAVTLTCTWDNGAPTDNNVMVFIHALKFAIGCGDVTYPTGWSTVNGCQESGTDASALYYRVASSEDTSFDIVLSGSEEQAVAAVEIEGPFEGSPLDDTDMEINTGSTTQTRGSGTVTTTVNDTIAIAGFTARNVGWTCENSPSVNNSFVFRDEGVSGSANDSCAYIYTRKLTATGSYNTTIDLSGTDEAYMDGHITTFKFSVAGGATRRPLGPMLLN